MTDEDKNDKHDLQHLKKPEPYYNIHCKAHGQLTNAKLDEMLKKISERLTSVKKHTRNLCEQQLSSWSDQKSDLSQPTHKSAPIRNNKPQLHKLLQGLDPMKQVELGLIYSQDVTNSLLEENEYFQDFMNLLVDDISPTTSLKSQQLTQDSSSCKTVPKKYAVAQEEAPSQMLRQQTSSTVLKLKQRVNETINKAEIALKNFKINQQQQRMKSSFRQASQK